MIWFGNLRHDRSDLQHRQLPLESFKLVSLFCHLIVTFLFFFLLFFPATMRSSVDGTATNAHRRDIDERVNDRRSLARV